MSAKFYLCWTNLDRFINAFYVKHVAICLLHNFCMRHICVMVEILIFSLAPRATSVELKYGVTIFVTFEASF